MLLKEGCNLLATAWKVARLKVMQISLIIEVVTQHSAFTNSSMIKRAQVHCQNMDRECVPSSSGIDINNDEETESVNQMKLHQLHLTTWHL
jgi:choline kinase